MADAAADAADAPKKSSKLPLILGVVLALAGGGGGFYAVQSGLLSFDGNQAETGHDSEASSGHDTGHDPMPDIAFIEMEPIIISLVDERMASHLRFRAQLEVEAEYKREVEQVMPRIIDVMNGYLRALQPEDFRDPLALTRLRSQMLRRVQIVTGKGRTLDILVMEFVLN